MHFDEMFVKLKFLSGTLVVRSLPVSNGRNETKNPSSAEKPFPMPAGTEFSEHIVFLLKIMIREAWSFNYDRYLM